MTIIAEVKTTITVRTCEWCYFSPCHCCEILAWLDDHHPFHTPYTPMMDALAAQEHHRRYYETRMAEDEAFREEVLAYNQL